MKRPLWVVALGGNALLRPGDPWTIDVQAQRIQETVDGLLPLLKQVQLVITHGNGPQVGAAFFRHTLTREVYPPAPLDVLTAETQGWIGYLIARAFRNRNIAALALVTQVVVDADDPAFQEPTKPIGGFMTRREAAQLEKEYGWVVREDAGRGWRVVVPSPHPREVLEADLIQEFLRDGHVVVAGGGGGIPVIRTAGGYRGVPAVVDKDRASAVLAKELGAEQLVILTQVDAVYLDYGKETARPLSRVDVDELERFAQNGQFPAGSMGPKVEAVIQFLRQGGQRALITSLEALPQALEGRAGTWIEP
ncbi:MAG: carbamate kinase [Candidatus Hydrothermae bacterium]|nr:carbamate kinase [Candidatus Hydrothermae bacterium]